MKKNKSQYSKQGSKVTLRKAKKYHKCEECNITIKPKEEYLEVTFNGKDFKYHTIRICKECMYKF